MYALPTVHSRCPSGYKHISKQACRNEALIRPICRKIDLILDQRHCCVLFKSYTRLDRFCPTELDMCKKYAIFSLSTTVCMNRKRHINIHIDRVREQQREWVNVNEPCRARISCIVFSSILFTTTSHWTKYQTLGHIVWHGRNSPEIRKITNNFSTFWNSKKLSHKNRAQQLCAIEMGRFLAAACKRIGILLCERC